METNIYHQLHTIFFLPSTLYQNSTITFHYLHTFKKTLSTVNIQLFLCRSFDTCNSIIEASSFDSDFLASNIFISNSSSNCPYEKLLSISLETFEEFLSYLTHTLKINLQETLFISSMDIELSFLKQFHLPAIAYKNPALTNQSLFQVSYLFEAMNDFNNNSFLLAFQRFHHYPVTILNTAHLILRELTIDDMIPLFEIYQNPSVVQFIPRETDLNELQKKHAAYIKNQYEFFEYGLWGVFLKSSNSLIGRCGIQQAPEFIEKEHIPFLSSKDAILELSYLIDSDFQHYGYAFEITRSILNYTHHVLGCHNIVSFIPIENTASINLAKRLNMKPFHTTFYQNQHCMIYYLDFKANYLLARKHTLRSFSLNPDTQVYGKRYKK